MRYFDIGDRSLATGDAFQEVLHVRPSRRRAGEVDLLLGHILGELLALEDGVFVDRLAAAFRSEVVAIDARLERSLVAVKDQRPRILRVRRLAPGAMLPGDIKAVVLEQGRLRVADIRFAPFLDEDAAVR